MHWSMVYSSYSTIWFSKLVDNPIDYGTLWFSQRYSVVKAAKKHREEDMVRRGRRAGTVMGGI